MVFASDQPQSPSQTVPVRIGTRRREDPARSQNSHRGSDRCGGVRQVLEQGEHRNGVEGIVVDEFVQMQSIAVKELHILREAPARRDQPLVQFQSNVLSGANASRDLLERPTLRGANLQ